MPYVPPAWHGVGVQLVTVQWMDRHPRTEKAEIRALTLSHRTMGATQPTWEN